MAYCHLIRARQENSGQKPPALLYLQKVILRVLLTLHLRYGSKTRPQRNARRRLRQSLGGQKPLKSGPNSRLLLAYHEIRLNELRESVRQMPEVRTSPTPTSWSTTQHNILMAIYEMGHGHSWENATRHSRKSLYVSPH
ncbi:hypothetical protein ACOSQ3_028817 [Xanthoceras sorbifolium]